MKELFKKADSIRIIAMLSAFLETLDGDKEYEITIQEHKQKRSLNANAYFWKLCDELAVKTREQKTDIYRHYIKEIGGNTEQICILTKAAEDFKRMWSAGHIGRFCEEIPSKLPNCTNLIVYTGSSDYDTAQMSRLIDMVVQDCKEQGIETLTPQELERLTEEWGR